MKQLELLLSIEKSYSKKLTFTAGKSYYWSPVDSTVYYVRDDQSEIGLLTLLHETSHGILGHTSYESDFDLVSLELEAWEHAKKLCSEYGVSIDHDHIENCLDSYRDWQYKRSLCPECDLGGVQIDPKTYSCLFCSRSWTVTKERFFRPYRKRVTHQSSTG